jgi:hypothetical protein
MWEGYRRHTGPELHTGGMLACGSKRESPQFTFRGFQKRAAVSIPNLLWLISKRSLPEMNGAWHTSQGSGRSTRQTSAAPVLPGAAPP